MLGLGERYGYVAAKMHPFIIWIGVAADAAKMTDSGILLLYFVRSSKIVNKMAVCISQMQRPGEILLLKKTRKQMARNAQVVTGLRYRSLLLS